MKLLKVNCAGLLLALSASSLVVWAEEDASGNGNAEQATERAVDNATGLPVLTPDELKNYQFENAIDWKEPKVTELTLGQQFVLASEREEIKELIERKLGVMDMNGRLTDLSVLQRIIDRKYIAKDDVKEWQSLGILFGDVLANNLDLKWVGYQDELGETKALQWRKTLNFVFPVTMLSRRQQFNQEINVQALYEKVEADIAIFAQVEEQLKTRYRSDREKSVMEVD